MQSKAFTSDMGRRNANKLTTPEIMPTTVSCATAWGVAAKRCNFGAAAESGLTPLAALSAVATCVSGQGTASMIRFRTRFRTMTTGERIPTCYWYPMLIEADHQRQPASINPRRVHSRAMTHKAYTVPFLESTTPVLSRQTFLAGSDT